MSIEINITDNIVEVTPTEQQVDINITENPIEVNVTDAIIVVAQTGLPGPQGPPGPGVAVGGTAGQILAKNSSTNYDTLWINAGVGTVTSVNASGVSGISVSGGPITSSGTLLITNTAPDQVVSLTGAGTTLISGTYPTFTITSNDEYDGTVTSVNASGGVGISVSGVPITSSGTLTITNTAPDQVVSLTGTGTTSISGTYPSFTINSADQYSGTVTSVGLISGTGIAVSGGPVTSSGNITVTNTAPDQIVSLSGSGTTTISGTYPSFTISSADQYTGTVTSIATTAPITGGTITASGTIGITQSGISTDGYLSSTDWNTFNNKQGTLTLTTTGTSGAATLVGNTLNIPQYEAEGSYVTTATTITINGVTYDLSANRSWSVGTVTSVAMTVPAAFAVAGSPITGAGTLAVTAIGTSSQYIRGDGQLANFPTNGGGGSSVNYYLNGSVNQGTFGGDTYYEMNKTPILGAGTNFVRTNGSGNGYIASFITDAGDPSLLNIPAGNWNLEFYFQASSGGGNPEFYGELYKVSSSNVFTLIASGSANPEAITNGTTVDQYFTSISVPQTTLLITDRLAIRVYVITGGRTITMHTENSNLCEVLTTFSTGVNALNGLTSQVQYFATGTSGTDFAISSATDTHTFNLPTASASNRGALSSADWTTFNSKQASGNYITALTGEATATGPGSVSITLTTSAVTGKLLTGLNLVGGGTIAATDSILQAFGKVQNQISGMVGGVTFQGVWNASTNTPTLTSSVGTKGYYYIVDVAGSTNLNGITDWKIGDWAIYNGTTWDKVDNTDAVSSVNGFTGAVSLTTANISEVTNLYYTEARVNANTNVAANTAARHNAVTIGTANGLSLSTQVLSLALASTSVTGALSSTDWNTFNGKESALTFSSPLVRTTNTISIPAATTSVNGYLSSTDWTTFNGKQNAITLTTTGTSGAATLVGATLNIPQYQAAGTYVTAVTGTSPIVSSGGTTPAISIPAATTSVNGYLTSTDWTTFNNKQNALTNPVTGTGTTNYLPKFTGTSTIGNSAFYDGGGFGGFNSTGLGARTFIIQAANARPLALEMIEYANVHAVYVRPNNSGYNLISSNYISGGVYIPLALSGRENSNDLVIWTDGNTSIGQSSNAGYKLDVNGTGRFQASVTTTQLISLSASGSAALFLKDGSAVNKWEIGHSANDLYFYNYTSATNPLVLSGSTGAATFSSSVTAGGSVDITGGSLASSNGLHLFFNTSTNTAHISAFNTGVDWRSMNFNALDYVFRTYDAARLTITSTGNVGIGTTSPLARLHVYENGAGVYTLLRINNDNSTANFHIGVGGSGVANSSLQNNAFVWNVGNSATIFGTNDTERMRITSGGNVGIGNTTPGEKLTVNGKGYFVPYLPAVLSGASGYYGTNITLASDIGATQGANRIWSRYDGSGAPAISIEVSTNSQSYNSDPQTLTYTEVVRIKGNGNVLIGTTTDDGINKLQVTGGAKVTNIALGAGTASIAPLDFNPSSAVLKTVNLSGDMEVSSGGHLYYSFWDEIRGVVSAEQFLTNTSTYTLTSTVSSQKLFNVGPLSGNAGALTVKPSTTYFFECMFSLTSMSATSGSARFDLKGAGTAGVSSAAYSSNGIDTTSITASGALSGVFSNSIISTELVTSATGTGMWVQIKGIFRTNTTAGTIIPSIQLVTAAAAIVGVNSFFRVYPIGSNTANYQGQ
jgi:hypothetical protein